MEDITAIDGVTEFVSAKVADFSIDNPTTVAAALAVGAVAIGFAVYKAGEAAAPTLLCGIAAVAMAAESIYNSATDTVGGWFGSEPA